MKAGPIAIQDVADIYLYPNTVRAVKVSGAQVREWLERSAGMFNRIDPAVATEQDADRPRLPGLQFRHHRRRDLPDRRHPALALRHNGKVVAPDAHRIVDLRFNGQPIDDAAQFIVATNNYRAGGGGNFPGADGKTIVLDAPDTNRDALVQYLQRRQRRPGGRRNWRLRRCRA